MLRPRRSRAARTPAMDTHAAGWFEYSRSRTAHESPARRASRPPIRRSCACPTRRCHYRDNTVKWPTATCAHRRRMRVPGLPSDITRVSVTSGSAAQKDIYYWCSRASRVPDAVTGRRITTIPRPPSAARPVFIALGLCHGLGRGPLKRLVQQSTCIGRPLVARCPDCRSVPGQGQSVRLARVCLTVAGRISGRRQRSRAFGTRRAHRDDVLVTASGIENLTAAAPKRSRIRAACKREPPRDARVAIVGAARRIDAGLAAAYADRYRAARCSRGGTMPASIARSRVARCRLIFERSVCSARCHCGAVRPGASSTAACARVGVTRLTADDATYPPSAMWFPNGLQNTLDRRYRAAGVPCASAPRRRRWRNALVAAKHAQLLSPIRKKICLRVGSRGRWRKAPVAGIERRTPDYARSP